MSRFKEGQARPTPESIAAHVLEAAPDAMLIVDREGNIVVANRQAESMFGYERAQMIGRHVEMLIPQRFRARHRSSMAAYFEAPHVRTMGTGLGLFGLRRDRTEFPVDIRLSPLVADGQTYVTAAVRELAPERQEAALGQWLAAIVASSDDAIIGKNLDGTITSWNAGAERIFGYSQSEAIGRPVTMLIPPGAGSEESEILARLRRGEHIDHYETKRRRKDGSIIDVSLTVSPVRTPQGEIIGASKIARDITTRKLGEQAIRAHALSRPIVMGIVRELLGQGYVPARGLTLLGRHLAGELPRRTIEEYAEALGTVGLGSLALRRVEGANYVFEGSDLIERAPSRASQPTCHLTLGFLEGAVEAIEAAPALGTEMRCQSLGHDACVFIVRARPRATP